MGTNSLKWVQVGPKGSKLVQMGQQLFVLNTTKIYKDKNGLKKRSEDQQRKEEEKIMLVIVLTFGLVSLQTGCRGLPSGWPNNKCLDVGCCLFVDMMSKGSVMTMAWTNVRAMVKKSFLFFQY